MLLPPFRKALENQRTRALLGLLAEAEHGLRYSEARSQMDENGVASHPEEFRRALRALTNAGIVQARTVPKKDRAPGQGRTVILEASVLGKVLWRYEQLKPEALRQAAEECGVELDQLQVMV